jgi:hypothetical protein
VRCTISWNDRDEQAGDDLRVGERRAPVAGEQLVGAQRTVSARAANCHPGTGRQRAASDLGGRVGVCEAAADGAAVAHAYVPDVRGRIGQQRAVLADELVLEQRAVPGQGRQGEPAIRYRR